MPAIPGDITTAVTADEAQALAALAAGKTVLELGADYGFSTVVLASVAALVYSVDTHAMNEEIRPGGTLAEFTRNITRYQVADRVIVRVGWFEDELPAMAAEGITVDGCFIDGHHAEEHVRRDLGLALPLVRPGGWVAFHDYGRGPHNGWPGFGVTQVADEFGVTETAGSLAWGYKDCS